LIFQKRKNRVADASRGDSAARPQNFALACRIWDATVSGKASSGASVSRNDAHQLFARITIHTAEINLLPAMDALEAAACADNIGELKIRISSINELITARMHLSVRRV
jgi:hypothetical protein